jgi:hypothetical protein
MTITPADRAVLLRGPYPQTSFNIRTITPLPGTREIEMTLESGDLGPTQYGEVG